MTLLALGFLGRVWWVFDLMANYRPQLGAVLLVSGVALWLVDRDAGQAAVFGGVVALAGMLPFYVGARPVPAAAAETIEIVSFNVGVSNPHREEIAEWILEEDPDVVFLFESSFEWEDAMRAAGVPLTLVTVVPRAQVAGVSVFASNRLSPTALEVDIGREVTALSVVVDGEPIELLGVHPPSPTNGLRAARRDLILDEAGDWVATRTAPVVVVGDLNSTPWSASYRRLRWRGMLVDTLNGRGLQTSWPDGWGFLSIPIDNVLHTPDLGSRGREAGPSFGSAHRSIVVSVGRAG